MEKIELKPKYVSKTFDSKKEFEKWLKDTTFLEIHFKDFGQDLTKIYVAKSGEILHCNFQANIYNGAFINVTEAELYDYGPIQILEDGKWRSKYWLLIDEVKKMQPTQE